eukprot:gnl/MRDRNA2_/MRDRNA2_168151_c0_seq1.p1 gnl/MRDRNA2_/MRDRNA2_168151_c0~~gnl/MRDRNA2_/MRDRNA2_168151_c0_seq1.p1  ORF type:complete len:465 (+),score=106.54 gnl/MRDRNA2_/MRDRNA2_168151_c0_seq1:174-1397(+)
MLPAWLKSHLIPAEPKGLANTAERRNAGWSHFHAPAGLTSLQWASLKEARIDDCRFESRVTEMVSLPGELLPRWRVSCGGKAPRSADVAEFDAVVFAGTATDAINLEGLKNALSVTQQNVLRGAVYDHRIAVSLLLKLELCAKIESLCGGKAELALEGSRYTGPLGLIARQEAKGRMHKSGCALTLHSTTQFAAQNLQDSKRAGQHPKERGFKAMRTQLADMLEIPLQALDAATIDSKVVHWRQCQVVRPRQERGAAVTKCMVASSASSLIVAGDYLADAEVAGSFNGCLESAAEAAKVACDILIGIAPGASSPAPASGRQCHSGENLSNQRNSHEAGGRGVGRGRGTKSRWAGNAASPFPAVDQGHEQMQQRGGSTSQQRAPRRWQRKPKNLENDAAELYDNAIGG